MVTNSQFSDFTYVNQLPKMSIKSENEETFTIVSCFSNYFATNRTHARNAILRRHGCLLQVSIDRER